MTTFNSSWYAPPPWAAGYISPSDAQFLHALIQRERPSLALEIGTASGFSTAMLCRSLAEAARSAGGDPGYRVISYDIAEHFYAAPSKRVGDATRELLDAALLTHVEFRNPRDAADAARDFAENEVAFCFIDANHGHPWPALDLLAVSDIVRPGGMVALHDINLRSLPCVAANPGCALWGVEWLFQELALAKEISTDPAGSPNTGALRMPADKQSLRRRLLEIINAHPWEGGVADQHLARLRLRRSGGTGRFHAWRQRLFRLAGRNSPRDGDQLEFVPDGDGLERPVQDHS